MTLDDVPDDATVVCTGMMGSVKAIESIGFATLLERWEQDFPLLTVVRAMEGSLGRPIDAVVPFEAGGLNSPVVLTLAARMGVPAVDGDALGRSAPETHMTSWHGHGVEITPMPLADSMGNIVIVSRAADPTYVDEIGAPRARARRAPGGQLPPSDDRRAAEGVHSARHVQPRARAGSLGTRRLRTRSHAVATFLGAERLFAGSGRLPDRGGARRFLRHDRGHRRGPAATPARPRSC